MDNVFNEILNQVKKIPVIDTHEHLPHCETLRDSTADVLNEYLSHYMSSDLISAGLTQDKLNLVKDPHRSILERWEVIAPYWEVCRFTGYGRALDIAVKGIYGIDGISRDTIETLNEAFKKNHDNGHFENVLKKLCGIEISILDAFTGRFEYDSNLFRRVWQPGIYVMPSVDDADLMNRIQDRYGIIVKNLDDWMEAFRVELDDALDHGIIGLKNALAYSRPLRFEKVNYTVAKGAFSSAYATWEKDVKGTRNIELPREVQDFMMHYVLQVANEKGLFMQIHTGLQEGNGNTVSNSDPTLLNNLFFDYPNVNFDLFHISYPYQGIASALCKNFPNVFIDMCWAHIISPSASISALSDFLDAVPYNKISGFGGDYLFVDGIYGHLYLARHNISKTLAHKVQEGVFGVEKAVEIAKMLLHDNPVRILNLKEFQTI